MPAHSPPSNDFGGSDIATGVLADANRSHGTRFKLVRPLRGGFQSGTWVVDDEDEATLSVLKWAPDSSRARQIQRAADAVKRVRAAGYPTPAWTALGVTQSGLPYYIQDYAPGVPPTRLTVPVAEQLRKVVETQRDLDIDPERCWSQYAASQLAGGWDTMRQHVSESGADAHRFVASIDELVASSGDAELPTGDMVHGDFRLGNVLFLSGQLAAVIDVEAMGSGSRAFDYATLLTVDDVDTDAWNLIRNAGERVAGPGVLARFFALVALDLANFVRERSPSQLPRVMGILHPRVDTLLRTPPA